MTAHTNPGQRLLDLFLEANSASPNVPVYAVWGGITGSSATIETAIADMIKIRALVIEVEQAITLAKPGKLEKYLVWKAAAEKVLDLTQPTKAWGEVRGALDRTAIFSLEFVAERLAERNAERAIDEKVLAELLKQVQRAMSKIAAGNLPEALKIQLLTLLREIENAILDYKVHGAAVLRRALERTIGAAAFMDRELIRAHADDEGVKEFQSSWSGLATVISLAADLKELAEPAFKFFLGDGSGPK